MALDRKNPALYKPQNSEFSKKFIVFNKNYFISFFCCYINKLNKGKNLL